MPKNIMICCDGTGNQIKENLSNVLKFYRVLNRNSGQVTYYDTGVGTIGQEAAWGRLRQNAKMVIGLATGVGLDANIVEAYQFLMNRYKTGDSIYLFGFSRGAYTVRALAGMVHLIGLLRPEQSNLAGDALTAYKRSHERGDLEIGWRFSRVMSTQRVTVKFLGVWDTVSSVMVQRADRFFLPTLQKLPYTRTNPSVEVFRHALAIDERRRMFGVNEWQEDQVFTPNPFDLSNNKPQDTKQVWFAGVHSDVGGGYPEEESAISKFPLLWMIDEAKAHGAKVNTQMVNRLAHGKNRKGARHAYVAPNPAGAIHESLTIGWKPLEYLPAYSRGDDCNPSERWHLPRGARRCIPNGALIHSSVLERMEQCPDYKPRLPDEFRLCPEDS